jgi:chromosome segregation ATPase
MKNNSPHRISTEITTEKIKIMNDIDLNALFNLNYNFDLLKGIIEQLLKNQNALQNQIDDLYGLGSDKDKRIELLEKEIKYLKETYVNKNDIKSLEDELRKIKENLKKHDDQIDESKTYNIFLYFNIFSIEKIEIIGKQNEYI